jgi:hypothetical protein
MQQAILTQTDEILFIAGKKTPLVKNRTMFSFLTEDYRGHDTYAISKDMADDPQIMNLIERNGGTICQ